MRNIVVLGSTGSIGVQTLDVVRRHPGELRVVGLAVNTRVDEMLQQARAFGVRHVAVGDARLADDARWAGLAAGAWLADGAASADELGEGAHGGSALDASMPAGGAPDATFGFGPNAVTELCRLEEADVVVNAL
ncbi:MAG TPA: 1-deoxy-D-xylulose-5-phosphate reductoisomerase, partial [Candidatus Aveggerthella excrementigallinarum]|nr:1-deoxy-D-xylulose-5-phosphate reductoisomerase [Candidatus Aveggerthella excrementigallinarum]